MDPWEQSSTVDPEVRAYVTSLVNAVGGSSTYDNTYSVGDDAIAVLKDLQRWLRLYDEKTNRFDVKRCLAEANLVRGDLLWILASWPEDGQEHKLKSRLALACLELLVPLTWPLALEDERATINHHRHVPFLQLAQVGYKRAILHFDEAKILRTAVRIGLPSMAMPRRERSNRDDGIIKLVLYFFRNMAMISQPQHLPSQGDENEVSRSSTIDVFHQQDIFNALLTIGSSVGDEFQEQDVILLEILFHLIKGVDPRKLFMEKEQVSTEETKELQMLIRKEKAMLNSYNKHAPSRHNRFGTMIWVKRDDQKVSTVSGQVSILDEATTLRQMDSSKKWNKPQYRGRLAHEFSDQSEFGMRVDLTESARKHLRQFVEDFLDSSFNPLFSSLRKAIEREADRVREDVHHARQYFYLISWFLSAESARRDRTYRQSTRNADRPSQTNAEDSNFAYIAAVLDQETFVLLNRQMQRAYDEKNWQDLQATLLCFTQILLAVQRMAASKDEDDQEIAENIQSRIFYEEATHDRIVQIMRGYTHQGFPYLDAITECVHVFVRMLELYSKENVDMHIRSKRRARTKRKQTEAGADNGDNDADEAAEDEREAHRAISERKFDFARFSAKFLNQASVNTFIALTHLYQDLTPVQLKRCHRYFYRLAFKHELSVLLFRVDILQLFHKMIKGPEGLDSGTESFKEWEQLIQQVFRRCIKWMERQTEGEGWKEAAVVEMLFSKVPGTLFYLQNGFDRVVEKRAPRPPAELAIKASVPEDQRVGVAVSMMIEQAKGDALSWVQGQLVEAINERTAWADAEAAQTRPSPENSDDEQAGESAPVEPKLPPAIFMVPDSDERKAELFKDKYLRLLLTTLGVQRLGLAEDDNASWVLPPELSATQLKEALEQMKKAEFDPPTFDDNKSAADLIRTKPTGRKGAIFDDDDDDASDSNGSGGELDEAMFPPNDREKRKVGPDDRPKKRRRLANRAELTEEERDERAAARRQRERERNAKIKSEKYITNSDDDTEDEEAFFQQEEARRIKMADVIRKAMLEQRAMASNAKKGKKRKSGATQAATAKKRKGMVSAGEDDAEDDEMQEAASASDSDHGSSLIAARRSVIDISDDAASSSDDESVASDSDDEENTPSTSPTAGIEKPLSPLPLKELSANARTGPEGDIVEDEDEDDAPVVKPVARRNVRAGFIIDSDSE